jgi:hypothetical protein
MFKVNHIKFLLAFVLAVSCISLIVSCNQESIELSNSEASLDKISETPIATLRQIRMYNHYGYTWTLRYDNNGCRKGCAVCVAPSNDICLRYRIQIPDDKLIKEIKNSDITLSTITLTGNNILEMIIKEHGGLVTKLMEKLRASKEKQYSTIKTDISLDKDVSLSISDNKYASVTILGGVYPVEYSKENPLGKIIFKVKVK